MAGYRSQLDALLEVRKYRKEVVHRELLEQEDLLSLEHERLLKCQKTSENALDKLAEYQKSVGRPEEMQEYYTFIKQQGEKITEQQEAIEKLSKGVEAKRDELKEVVQEKKILEKVIMRQKEAQSEKTKKNEEAFLDDIGGRLTQRSYDT